MTKLFLEARKKGFEAVADDIARRVVHFDASHAEARAWLGLESEDSAWRRPKDWTPHTNTKEKGSASFRKRWKRKAKSLVRSFWRILDKAPKDLDDHARGFLHCDVSALDVDDKRLRREWKWELAGRHWLTIECRKARETWNPWQDAKDELRKKPAEAVEIELHERLVPVEGVDFTSKYRVGDVSIWSTYGRKDAVDMANLAIRAARMFALIFDRPYTMPEGMGFIVVESRQDQAAVAAGLGVQGIRRIQPGFDVPGTNLLAVGRWQGWPANSDTLLRFLLHRLYVDAFGWNKNCEWAAQGVSLLLTHISYGSRLSIIGWNNSTQTRLDRALENVLFTHPTDWITHARDLINEGMLPSLVELEPQSRTQLWVVDSLACYIAAYYITVIHNKHAAGFYKRLGKGEGVTAALKAELGLSLAEFDERLARWLNDYRRYEEGKSKWIPVKGKLPRLASE